MKTQKNGKGNNINVIRLLIDLFIQNQGHSYSFMDFFILKQHHNKLDHRNKVILGAAWQAEASNFHSSSSTSSPQSSNQRRYVPTSIDAKFNVPNLEAIRGNRAPTPHKSLASGS